MKKLLIVSGWMVSSSLTLLVSISTLHLVRNSREIEYIPALSSQTRKQSILSYHSLIDSISGIRSTFKTGDARPILIQRFLQKYNSPLRPYDYWGQVLVEISDRYSLDYRLLPAMAMQESNLCKKIPSGSFNCLGLGIHSQGTWGFDTFEANFETAAKILRNNYLNQGLITPAEIQSKYTPSSNGSWQSAVNQFMNQIEAGNF
jgi:hypothetical protein